MLSPAPVLAAAAIITVTSSWSRGHALVRSYPPTLDHSPCARQRRWLKAARRPITSKTRRYAPRPHAASFIDEAADSAIRFPPSSPRTDAAKRHSRHSLHLLSLPHPPDGATASGGPRECSLLEKCWSWKDAALGDEAVGGADYLVPRMRRRRRRSRIDFVPRSAAIGQFQRLFLGGEISVVVDDDGARIALKTPHGGNQESSEGTLVSRFPSGPYLNSSRPGFDRIEEKFTVEECSVLSTCARLNVILVLRSASSEKLSDSARIGTNSKHMAKLASRYAVACNLHQQIRLPAQSAREQRNEVLQISDLLTHFEGARSISSHLCLVASGLAPRPDRPGDPDAVIFRPYSSHDSHIMMQLKRAVELISVRDWAEKDRGRPEGKGARRRRGRRSGRRSGVAVVRARRQGEAAAPSCAPSRGRIKVLLDGALRAGKLARNEGIVPEIEGLKRFRLDDGIPPDELNDSAIQAVMEKAIEPTIASSVARLLAMETDTSDRILRMRRRVEGVVDELLAARGGAGGMDDGLDGAADKKRGKLKKLANELLHAPTMQLRREKLSDRGVEDAVVAIERQLREYQCNAAL